MPKPARLFPWLMVLPCVLILVFVMIFPLIYSLTLSFHEWIITKSPYWHFNYGYNYVRIIGDSRFHNALRVTAILGGSSVALEFVFGLILALLLNREIRGKRYLVAIFTTPMMIVPVIAGFIWRVLWLGEVSPINYALLKTLGFAVPWLDKDIFAQLAVIISNVWQWTPFMFLILLAGFSAIPVELYESAQVDGATGWHMFTKITLPMARPLIILAILIRAMEEIKIFDLIFLITHGGPAISTESVSLYLYNVGFIWFDMGYAAACSFILLIIVTIIVQLFIRAMPKR
ncbi:MAG: sugar ABC transporter permease [Candidatus Bathyarchaeia archaeon]